MEKITRLGKNIYLQGEFNSKDLNSNYGYPVDFPTIFIAYGKAIQSGNWQSCTGINTPEYITKYFNEHLGTKHSNNYGIKLRGLTKEENYEFWGLLDSISKASEAYGVFRFGNHGTDKGENIRSWNTAKAIFEGIKPMAIRANILLNKIN